LGTFGDASAYSFQANKIVDAGEGGMLGTNDPELIVKSILLSDVRIKILINITNNRNLNQSLNVYLIHFLVRTIV